MLVVDDHELFSTSLVVALRSCGVNAERIAIVCVDAVPAAVSFRSVGVVVLDLDLGWNAGGRGLDGLDLLTTLRDEGWNTVLAFCRRRSGDVTGRTPNVAHAAPQLPDRRAVVRASARTVEHARAGGPQEAGRRMPSSVHRRRVRGLAHDRS